MNEFKQCSYWLKKEKKCRLCGEQEVNIKHNLEECEQNAIMTEVKKAIIRDATSIRYLKSVCWRESEKKIRK